MNNFKHKYSKYKHKYKMLKKQIGGNFSFDGSQPFSNDFEFDRWEEYNENHENSELHKIDQKYLHIAKLLDSLIKDKKLLIMDEENMVPWEANAVLGLKHNNKSCLLITHPR